MIDLVIRNATLYDGSGAPPSVGDLGIDGGRIVSVGGPVADGVGREEIDVAGLAVAPGSSTCTPTRTCRCCREPGCLSAIEQGITTQAVGLCGFSAGPLSTTRASQG